MLSPIVVLVLTAQLYIVEVASRLQQQHHGSSNEPSSLSFHKNRFPSACPHYKNYASVSHLPLSDGPLQLPYQRIATGCRTFRSLLVERVIEDVTSRMVNRDLARLFENAFPNTLDTTISWHVDGTETKKQETIQMLNADWHGPHTFCVTGDINAEWLRDSTNQLAQYQALAPKDVSIKTLLLGAIATQVEYVIDSPYCNAFQPPPPSGLAPTSNGQGDTVHPAYEERLVFECKYELDSLAHFLKLGNQFYHHTQSNEYLTPRFYMAIETLLNVLEEQSQPTFNPTTGRYRPNEYRFQRSTMAGTETLNLAGIGNPILGGSGLIRSAFRPSDDATILPFFIPANAMMAVELKRAATVLKTAGKLSFSKAMLERAASIEGGIREHAIVSHKKYGDVFAFEVDGYGSHILMDDANLPSLLSLPDIGFVDRTDDVYKNTRKMILEQSGNPYFLTGKEFSGIGGPHIGLRNAWPMSRLVQARTSDNDTEIMESISAVLNSSRMGLIHESINVDNVWDYTRSWFAWACGEFSQTILDLAERKPHLIFGPGAKPFKIQDAY